MIYKAGAGNEVSLREAVQVYHDNCYLRPVAVAVSAGWQARKARFLTNGAPSGPTLRHRNIKDAFYVTTGKICMPWRHKSQRFYCKLFSKVLPILFHRFSRVKLAIYCEHEHYLHLNFL